MFLFFFFSIIYISIFCFLFCAFLTRERSKYDQCNNYNNNYEKQMFFQLINKIINDEKYAKFSFILFQNYRFLSLLFTFIRPKTMQSNEN